MWLSPSSQQQGTLGVRLAQYRKPKLLIIDELGYLPLELQAGHLFFQLISRRYEKGSVLISSSRPVEEWDEVYSFGEGFAYGDQVVAAAILDRLLHHSHVVTIRGDSYRLKEKRRSGLRRTPNQAEPMPSPSNNTTPTDETPIQGQPEGTHQQTIRWTSFRVARGRTTSLSADSRAAVCAQPGWPSACSPAPLSSSIR
jgi:hypothetical protein